MKTALQHALLDAEYGSAEYLDATKAITKAADTELPLHKIEELLDRMERQDKARESND